ncbi:polysaccharide lyase family 7 protein [Kribbella sp. NPDC050124]|uniref:polysaccharide lyase family 7 protein n=1 Tax=Kribbella sp. NPDC050124 TaxID=3364114 RepID=UPI0037A951C1
MKRAGTTVATAGLLASALVGGAVWAGVLPTTSAASGEITPAAGAVRASTSDDNLPGNAVDDDLETRWSGNGDGAWLELDLGAPTTVAAIATYSRDPYFKVDGNGVQFRAPVNGVTTSGSSYPRAELREMTDNGTKNAAWSSTSGTHTLTVKEAFVKLPAGKPHVVGAQIHGGDDAVTVFRLEGTKLYITNGDDSNYGEVHIFDLSVQHS